MDLNLLRDRAHDNSKGKGFWEDLVAIKNALYATDELYKIADNFAVCQKIALIHDEIDEAAEVIPCGVFNWRDPSPHQYYVEELADVVIRVFDLAGFLEADLQTPYDKFLAPLADGASLLGLHHATSRVLQAHRKGWSEDSIPENLAAIIYLADAIVKDLGVNFTLEDMVLWKMKTNEAREYKHGAAY